MVMNAASTGSLFIKQLKGESLASTSCKTERERWGGGDLIERKGKGEGWRDVVGGRGNRSFCKSDTESDL